MLDVPDGAPASAGLPPTVFIPIYKYAERHPSLPIGTVVECAVRAFDDPELLTARGGWLTAVDHAINTDLAELDTGQVPPSPRRRGRPRKTGTHAFDESLAS